MKPRMQLLFVFILLLCKHLQAQDELKLKNEQRIKVKIIEVTQSEIKYKKFENIDGPIYTIPKTDALEITHQNGSTESIDSIQTVNAIKKQKLADIDVEIEKRRIERIEKAKIEYERCIKIYEQRKKGGKLLVIVGPTVLVTGIGLTTLGGILLNQYEPGGYYGGSYIQPRGNLGAALSAFIPGFVMMYAGLGMTIAGSVKLNLARKYKRRAEDAKAALSFEPSILPNYLTNVDRASITGVSLKLKF